MINLFKISDVNGNAFGFLLACFIFIERSTLVFYFIFNTSTKTVNCCQRKWFPIHLIFKHFSII